MMIYTVDENLSSKNASERAEVSVAGHQSASNPKKCSRCLLSFIIVSISFIVLCCIIMAVMTASVFSKTNDLKDLYQKNKQLDLIFSNESSGLSNDQFQLERNMLGWLKNTIQKKILGNHQNKYLSSNEQYFAKYSPQECGIPGIQPRFLNTRIMNGKEAIPNSWPWAVSIGLEGPRDKVPHACGGTLINKRIVITAAHCVIRNSIFTLVGNPTPYTKYNSIEKMMRIYIGVHDRVSIDNKNIYGVESIVMHERFDPITFKNDIAIIRLDRDVSPSYGIGFACLGKLNQVQPGDTVYAIGWGYTENSRNQGRLFVNIVN